MSKILIGWSEVSLIPEGVKVDLAGQFYERITNDVETPLTVTALAVTCGDESAVFCSCDLVSTSRVLLLNVRKFLKDRSDIPADKVIVSAIHTHTAPVYADRSDTVQAGAMSGLDVLCKIMPQAKYETLVSYEGQDLFNGAEAHEYIAKQIAKAVVLAWDGRKESIYSNGFGRAAVGMNRRVCYDDGSAKMWGDTNMANFTELEGGNDSGIELMFTYTPDKKLTGVIANVACPAQVLEHRSFISSDYWGKVKERLRAKFGEELFVLGLCSPAGDQCPRDLVRWVEPETPINDPNIVRNNVIERKADPSMFDLKGCKLVGRRIADEILYALEDVSDYVSDTTMEHRAQMLTLPLRRVTIAEKDAAEKAISDFSKSCNGVINFKDKARLHIHAGVISRYDLQQKVDTVDIEVHFLRIGNLAFATNPYELFLDYGNKIRARVCAEQTFLIQLCCGSFGYLPTKKAEAGSHYSAYVSSGTVGHEAGDLLVRTTVQNLNEMLK